MGDDLEQLHIKEPEQIEFTDDLFGDLIMDVLITPSPAVTPVTGVAFLPLQNALNKRRLVDRVDNVTIAAQQFYALKAAGVKVPDIFDGTDQNVADVSPSASDNESVFNKEFFDEEEPSSSSKDLKLRSIS